MELRVKYLILAFFLISFTFVVATTSGQDTNQNASQKSSSTTITAETATTETKKNVIKVKRKKAINTEKLEIEGENVFYLFYHLRLLLSFF
jgi:hypothetical protein